MNDEWCQLSGGCSCILLGIGRQARRLRSDAVMQ